MNQPSAAIIATVAGGLLAVWLKARRDQPALEARTRARLAPCRKVARP